MPKLDETTGDRPRPRPGSSAVRQSAALLTLTEAGALLRLSRRSVERLVSRGILPCIALPLRRGGLRFRREDLAQFLADRYLPQLE